MEINLIWKIALVATALIVGIGSRFFCKSCMKDSVVEEMCEEIIHDNTGIDIDLSPESKEKQGE